MLINIIGSMVFMDILSSQSQNNIRQQFREMLQMLTKNLKASLFIIMNKTWKEDHLLTNHLAQISHLLQQLKFDQQSPSTSDVVVNANCAGMAPSYNCTSCFTHINNDYWILDCGAFEHMTFNKSVLIKLKLLSFPLTVNLLNSYRVKVTHSGSVALFSNLILHNVLFVPTFRFNFLSVHKLCKQFSYLCCFSSTDCVL